MKDRAAELMDLCKSLPEGRDNAISIGVLAKRLRRSPFRAPPASSTVRALIHEAQEAGWLVLSSPRAGVWIAADDGEALDVLEELRATVTAIEKRMQMINGGKCALRSCRAELTEKIKRRGGLYCGPTHRYQAAVVRGAS